jgi:hypothetical protein
MNDQAKSITSTSSKQRMMSHYYFIYRQLFAFCTGDFIIRKQETKHHFIFKTFSQDTVRVLAPLVINDFIWYRISLSSRAHSTY